jgi:hypothetical protein
MRPLRAGGGGFTGGRQKCRNPKIIDEKKLIASSTAQTTKN